MFNHFLAVEYMNGNFGYAVGCSIATCRFNIYNCVHHSGLFLEKRKGVEVLNFLAMNKSFGKLLSFQNRLQKVYRHLSKQAKKQGISCYRIYDHDLPEAPFIIEVYDNKLYVSEFKRRHHLTEEEHEQ